MMPGPRSVPSLSWSGRTRRARRRASARTGSPIRRCKSPIRSQGWFSPAPSASDGRLDAGRGDPVGDRLPDGRGPVRRLAGGGRMGWGMGGVGGAARCGDWQGSDAASVLRVMGRNPLQARDVPVAMEMVALLQHFATRLDVRDVPGLGVEGQEDVELTPGIVWGGSKLLVLLDVPAGAFDDIAYWVADSLPSAKIKAMPGVLALPFTIESTGEGDEAQAVL